MNKFFLIGSSSYLLKNFEKFLTKNGIKFVSISRKNNEGVNKIKKHYKTNYSNDSLKKIFNKEINNNIVPIFVFGNVITQSDLFINFHEKNIEKLIDVNIKLPIRILRIILKNHLRNKPVFFNISSIRINPGVGFSLYGSSKIFMENLFQQLSMEYGKLGCIFKSLRIGISKGGIGKSLNEKVIKDYIKRTSINELIDIKEIYETLIFEIDKKSSNGKVIYCDNGFF